MSAPDTGRRPRVRAPELAGRGWLNTGGATLRLADLRGRFVLLDFWAFCCVNCLHVLDELRPLEEKYADELVVVGVHSPKFVHEADPDALAAAVERYDVEHPVLDDPELVTWQAYTARAWPTLVLVDPEGYVVAQYAGEGHAHAIDALLAELRRGAPGQGHAAAGRLAVRRRRPSSRRPAVPGQGGRRCPAAASWSRTPATTSLVELAADAETVVRRIGSGERGLVDGGRAVRSTSPTACACCPTTWPPRSGTTSWSPTPSTTRCAACALATGDGPRRSPAPAGSGCRATAPTRAVEPLGRGLVAGPGLGRDGRHPPALDLRPAHRRRRGGRRHHQRGAARRPARRGVVRPDLRARRRPGTGCGSRTARPPALRYVEDGEVHTAVGTGLFDFGFRDGDGRRRRCSSTRSA